MLPQSQLIALREREEEEEEDSKFNLITRV
ncbi:hypothetical protein KM1_193530 [Entamoeba histolytica HM-3:IMSS]|uniref:Uncharacterized protein n=1 Tax=Entamoeba histolytica HM-3:IMSS TaxID=885315 RepID=M7VVH3_ENTHI|nr:hypothetical protein KM1_193530 [Entamoeba histolytica HM-3:IMSS]